MQHPEQEQLHHLIRCLEEAQYLLSPEAQMIDFASWAYHLFTLFGGPRVSLACAIQNLRQILGEDSLRDETSRINEVAALFRQAWILSSGDTSNRDERFIEKLLVIGEWRRDCAQVVGEEEAQKLVAKIYRATFITRQQSTIKELVL